MFLGVRLETDLGIDQGNTLPLDHVPKYNTTTVGKSHITLQSRRKPICHVSKYNTTILMCLSKENWEGIVTYLQGKPVDGTGNINVVNWIEVNMTPDHVLTEGFSGKSADCRKSYSYNNEYCCNPSFSKYTSGSLIVLWVDDLLVVPALIFASLLFTYQVMHSDSTQPAYHPFKVIQTAWCTLWWELLTYNANLMWFIFTW